MEARIRSRGYGTEVARVRLVEQYSGSGVAVKLRLCVASFEVGINFRKISGLVYGCVDGL